jgi:predicted transport protein
MRNGNETSSLEYQIDGKYAIFESAMVSDLIFVYEEGSMLWLIIVLAVIVLLEVAFLVFLFKKKNGNKSVKLSSAYPPFVFGMFLAEWQLVMIIVLAVAVVALGVVSTIFAIKFFGKKNKANNEVAVAEETEDDTDFDVSEVRVSKSFSERLSQASLEVNEYYNSIKDELLSYKGVKSKISFKHESFRLGREIVARLKIRGKSLYLFLALNPSDYQNSKYKIKDVSSVISNKAVPTMYKVNLPRRATYAKELIADLMVKLSAVK